MRKEYNFKNSIKNPYVKKSKKKISMNVDEDIIEYFKNEAAKVGVPYQTLMNLYLKDCADNKKKLKVAWQ